MIRERVRYSAWGIPTRIAQADINWDGVQDQFDVDGLVASIINGSSQYIPRADLNSDGVHDAVDLDIFQQPWGYSAGEDGRGQLSGTDLSGLSYGDAVAERKNLDNRIGFGGYMWDPWLGAYHVRHRVYDPNLRRWLQVDPIGYAGGDWDLSRYANGDPVNFIDPLGLCSGSPSGAGAMGAQAFINIRNYFGNPDNVRDTVIRVNGAMKAACGTAGGVSTGTAAVLTTPTGVGGILFGAATVVFADLASSGWQELGTGEPSPMVTVEAITEVLVAAGFSEEESRQAANNAVNSFMGGTATWSEMVRAAGANARRPNDPGEDASTGGASGKSGRQGSANKEAATPDSAEIGRAANAKGRDRVKEAAEFVDGRIPTKEESYIKSPKGRGGTDLDLFGPNDELIGVGGGAKGFDKSHVGKEIAVLMDVAEARGTCAMYILANDTPASTIDWIRGKMGPDNVLILPYRGK